MGGGGGLKIVRLIILYQNLMDTSVYPNFNKAYGEATACCWLFLHDDAVAIWLPHWLPG